MMSDTTEASSTVGGKAQGSLSTILLNTARKILPDLVLGSFSTCDYVD